MDPIASKPWYKKARYLVPIGILALICGVSFAGDSPASTPSVGQVAAPTEQAASVELNSQTPAAETQAPSNTADTASNAAASAQQGSVTSQSTTATQPAAPSSPTTQPSGLSNDNYYTNSSGNTVHSPANASSIPAGASAQCRDGTYSFSQHRSGTCSHHGGVAVWY